MSSNYEPQVNDYVIWEREAWNGIHKDEGWVYFNNVSGSDTEYIKK